MGCALSSVPDGDYVVDTLSVIECESFKWQLNANTSKLNVSEGNWFNSRASTLNHESLTLEGTPTSFQILGLRLPIQCEGQIENRGGLYYLKGEATYGANTGTYTIGLEPSIAGINAAF